MKLPGLVLAAWLAASTAEPLAIAPPMGWNSWDSYGTTVTEAEVKANAAYMAAHLKGHGWQYVVVDIQWSDAQAKAHGYRPNAELTMDEYGRLLPAPNRFPSSANGQGFLPLAGFVHGQGLKFGIHIMRGIPRRAVASNLPVFGSKVRAAGIADRQSVCRWNTDMYGVDMSKPGAQDYYDALVNLYAAWGVDYIKADDMAQPFHGPEIEALHRAIVKSGRPIVLSLSPGPAELARAGFYAANANLWRISDDFWDRWQDLRKAFDLLDRWSPYTKPGGWPDADMLPLGHIGIRAERGDDRMTRFTRDEQRTLMTLWCIARSPLMFGGDLPSNDGFTLSLMNNDEVLAVNQKGTGSHRLFARGDSVAWISDAGGGQKYLAVFNLGENPAAIRVEWRELRLPANCRLRDLWANADLGRVKDGYTASVPPHGANLYRVTPPSPPR